jgi:HEAT repeat protein
MCNVQCRRIERTMKLNSYCVGVILIAAFGVMPHVAHAASPEDGLIAVLTSTASVADKDAACRELKIVGTEKSVPALAALLTDDKLAHPARFALESMPYAPAGAALRDAVGKTKGLIRSGMIDSLGERRDASAVPVIAPALNDPDNRVVAAAAWALGKIGTTDAAAALRTAHDKADGPRRATIGQGLVLCANNLLKAGKAQDAMTVFFGASAFAKSTNARSAALVGIIRAMGPGRAPSVFGYLAGDDPAFRAAGASILPDLSTDELCVVAAGLGKLPPSSQIAVLSAARIRGDQKLLPIAHDALKGGNEAVRVAAIRALGAVGDISVLPQLVQCAAKEGDIGKAAQASIAMLKGRDIDAKIIAFLKGEKDAERRAAWIDVIAFRHPGGAVDVLTAEALHADPIVRGHAMTALAQVAAPNDLAGLLAGVVAAQPGAERDSAERAVVLLLAPLKPAGQRAVQVFAAIDASPGDHLLLLPLAARFGSPAARQRVMAALADRDPKVHETGLHALCNWPNAGVAEELLQQIDAAKEPALRTMLLRAYTRVVSTPAQGANAAKNAAQKDAQRLAGLKRAMDLAQQDEERAYILQRASAVRTLASLRFVLPYVDQPALAEPACAAVAELAHHKELRDPNKTEFRPAVEKVLRTTKDQAVRDNCTRSRDQMNEGSR